MKWYQEKYNWSHKKENHSLYGYVEGKIIKLWLWEGGDGKNKYEKYENERIIKG